MPELQRAVMGQAFPARPVRRREVQTRGVRAGRVIGSVLGARRPRKRPSEVGLRAALFQSYCDIGLCVAIYQYESACWAESKRYPLLIGGKLL